MDSGAINKQTSQYVLPDKGSKSHEYICPDCNKDLILCKGKIRKPYFRHKVDKEDPCTYYTNPSETQIHKDAKLRFKELFETKKIKVNRECQKCKKTEQQSLPNICNKSKICIEYKFEYNESTKFADVAYLKDGKMTQIYEICQTHKTKENNRPEPWFEFNAGDIIELSKKEDNYLEINCIRDKYCDECKYKNSESKYELLDDDDCYACNNTGTSYWSDGVCGPCMECDRGDDSFDEKCLSFSQAKKTEKKQVDQVDKKYQKNNGF